MLRLLKIINRTLSVRISLMVVSAMALLLMASLAVMLYYSKKAVKEEALQKASQTLDGTVEHIDNILLSVEQSVGNTYFNLLPQLSNPDIMSANSRNLVESNPYISGCAIAFKEDFYKGRKYFMAHHYRTYSGIAYSDSPCIQPEVFGNYPYPKQAWFTKPMTSGKPGWLSPTIGIKDNIEPITTFCLPIVGNDGKPVGVIRVEVSLNLLSHIVAEAKPSANSYCTLLDSVGSFIVYPESDKLLHQSAFTLSKKESDPSLHEAVQAMVSGETGYRPFRMRGNDYYVFYKPFERNAIPGRSMEKLGWSVGIIYPEDDILGDYNDLSYFIFAIATVCLLILFLLSRTIISHQLMPLEMLSEKAQLIAKGNYDETIPDSHQKDEIGRLQDNFQQMQQNLSVHIGELEQLITTLRERGEGLRAAYNEAQKADRMKTAFLHNMTNQMLAPAETIDKDVDTLCKTSNPNTSQLVDNIQQNGHTIAELLKNFIYISDEERLGNDEKGGLS